MAGDLKPAEAPMRAGLKKEEDPAILQIDPCLS
jgi:hypothetical protein